MLTTLLLPKNVFENEYKDKLQTWRQAGLRLVLLKDGSAAEIAAAEIEAENALWLVTCREEFLCARAQKIASLVYLPEEDLSAKSRDFAEADTIITGFEEIEASYFDRIYRRYHHLPWILYETDEFRLRELTMEDMDGLFALYEDPTITRFVEPLYPRKEEEAFQEAYIRNMYGFYGYGLWVIEEKATGRIAGRAGLEHWNRDGETQLELGYLLHSDFRGRGLATEICSFILDYARVELEAKLVTCRIDADNVDSIALAKRLGFRQVGPEAWERE